MLCFNKFVYNYSIIEGECFTECYTIHVAVRVVQAKMLAVSTVLAVLGKYVFLRTFERHQRNADWLLLPCQEKCYSTDI